MAHYETAPRQVVEARYVGDYRVWLQFDDRRRGLVDLADELHGELFRPQRDREQFARLYLDCPLATIAWEHGADFASDFLYKSWLPCTDRP